MHALSMGSQLLYLRLCINRIRPEYARNTSLAPLNRTLIYFNLLQSQQVFFSAETVWNQKVCLAARCMSAGMGILLSCSGVKGGTPLFCPGGEGMGRVPSPAPTIDRHICKKKTLRPTSSTDNNKSEWKETDLVSFVMKSCSFPFPSLCCKNL